MPYLGPGPTFGSLDKQTLIPDSIETTFNLNYTVSNPESLLVNYGGVIQEPVVSYDTGGATITFTFTPQTDTMLYVVFLGKQIDIATPAANTVNELSLQSAVLDILSVDGGSPLAKHKNLVIIRPTVTTVDIDADSVLVTDGSGRLFATQTVNLTATITTSGANGLDTGTEASSTWYHLWVIYNGTTVASLMSLSSTAPTMPSGYTFKGYVGAIRNNGSSDLVAISQKGVHVSSSGLTAILTSGSATTTTSIDASGAVPTTAKIMNIQLRVDHPTPDTASTIHIYSDSGSSYKGAELKNPGTLIPNGASGGVGRVPLLTPQTIWYGVDSANEDGFVWVYGWEY